MSQDTSSARPGRAGLAIGICFLVAALEGYDIQAFGVAAPHFVPQLGLNPAQQGMAGSIAMIGLVAAAFVGGWLADRVGRKPVLIGSVLVFGIGSIWTSMIHGYDPLLAARFVTGLGFGAALPNLIAMAAELSPPAHRGATTSAMFCGMPAGGTAVALFARAAGDSVDWRAIFMVGGLLPLILVPVMLLLLPETRPPGTAATGERRTLKPLFDNNRTVPTLLLWVGNLLTLVTLYLMLNWLPTLVALGHTKDDGAAASLVFNASGIVGALVLGFVVDRVGFRWSLLVTYAALAAVMAAMASAAQVPALLALSSAAGFLVHAGLYSLYGAPPRLYPRQAYATGAGIAVGVGRFGSIIGPLLAGELRNAGWTPGQVFGVLLPVTAVAGAAVFLMTFLAPLGKEPPPN